MCNLWLNSYCTSKFHADDEDLASRMRKLVVELKASAF